MRCRNRDVPYGRTDGHDQANSRSSQFCGKRLRRKKHPRPQRDPNTRSTHSSDCRPYGRRLLLLIYLFTSKCYFRTQRHGDREPSVHANCCPRFVMRAVRIQSYQQGSKGGVGQHRNQVFARSHNVAFRLQFCNHDHLMQQALTQNKVTSGTYPCRDAIVTRLPDIVDSYVLFAFDRKQRQKTNNGPDVTSSEFCNTYSDYNDDDDNTMECVPF